MKRSRACNTLTDYFGAASTPPEQPRCDMNDIQPPETLLHRLCDHVSRRPDAPAYAWLVDAGAPKQVWSNADLATRVATLSAHLRTVARPGDRAVLLYGPGLEFIAAFLACLAAGVVAVPAYPPRNRRHHPRLDAIVLDADPALVLVGDVGAAKVGEWLDALPGPARPMRIDTSDIVTDSAAGLVVHCGPDDLALLQYTSGSTATPKGVMVTHANIVHNSECLRRAFHLGSHSVGVSWLPSFHDMGLIDGVLQPLYTGFPAYLMAPSTFIQRPATWLEAITRYRGTHCGGPNFAYEACLLGVTEAQKDTLDLRSWETAYNGAEPVRRETLEAFAQAFARCGFSPRQFYPCYGLAESTLIVTGSDVEAPPVYFAADADALEQHRVRPADDPDHLQARHLVGCGTPVDGLRVTIVDPDTHQPCAGDQVGEIWVAGPSVAAGYWRRDEATIETFRATTADGEGPFLRTGDLGFQRAGELFVTGRIKDLVIIRGRNHYPQDIEVTAAAAHLALARGQAACFSVDADGEERLILTQEVPRTHARALPSGDVLQAIRSAVVQAHEVDPWDILLVPALALPKTSSGKLQRRDARRRYLDGDFTVLARARAATPDAAPPPPSAPSSTAHDIEAWLVAALARTLQAAPEAIGLDQPFAALGLDSLAATRLAGALQDHLQRPVSPTLVYDYPTVRALAAYLGGAVDEVRVAQPHDPDAAIAIVGIGCRFPGAHGPAAFWELLQSGVDAVGPVPAGRWSTDAFDAEPGRRGTYYAPRGGFLPAIDTFDAGFFDISPNEADRMDPQQRLLLETAWEACEHAGMRMSALAGTETGVFVGISTSDYRALQFGALEWLDHHAGTGNAASIAANRLSYLFDLRGPSLAVDTACSSSLLAVHLAGESLRRGECGLALAGGVNLMVTPDLTVAFSQARMLSAGGACRAFDAGADGYVRGEGCGVVVLKRLEDAVRDGDRVIAVLRASAVNQDGRTNGLTAPNGVSQQRVLRGALARAGLGPEAVQYVEAHGTGTPLGDPIELHAIRAVYGERDASAPLWVGSVKTNIGHLESAAGVASLIKAALALQARTIPPHLHFRSWNPEIDRGTAPIAIPLTSTPWPATTTPRAAVSAFGFGGTNVHVVLEAAPVAVGDAATDQAPAVAHAVPLLLSARTPTALRRQVEQYRDVLRVTHGSAAAVARTALAGRDHWAWRTGVVGATPAALAEALDDWLARPAPVAPVRAATGVVFLYTGQGSQYAGMAAGLEAVPAAREVLDRLTSRLRDRHGVDLQLLLQTSSPEGDRLLAQTKLTQPALYILQCALTACWRASGIVPAAVIGHSVGEFAAAAAAGVFSEDDGLDLIAARGRLMEDLGEPGAMVAIGADASTVLALVPDLALELAAENGPAQVVLAGTVSDVDVCVARCEAQGLSATRLATTRAFHSALIERALPGLQDAAARITHRAPTVPWVSNVTGTVMTTAPSPDYWVTHARQPVRFASGLRALDASGIGVGLEVGPSPILISLARRTLPEVPTWVASLERRCSATEAIARATVSLYTAGVTPADSSLWAPGPRVDVPTYPFAPERHWFAPPVDVPARAASRPQTAIDLYEVAWDAQDFAKPATGPSLQAQAAHLATVEPALRHQARATGLPDALQALDSVALDWAHGALATLAAGALLPGRAATVLDDVNCEAWNRHLHIAPRHHRLATRLWRWLAAHARVERTAQGWQVAPAPDAPAASARIAADYPEVGAEARLLTRCGPALADVLRGTIDPLHLLFPGGDFTAAAAIYADAPAAQLLNGQVAAALTRYLADRPHTEPVRVIELGAGTGGLTTYLLPVLAAWGGPYEYVFSDLSPSFLEQARARFRGYPDVVYRLLDLEALEREPSGHYDLAVAANAVHAVARLAPVLAGLHGVLRPGGQLWLLEGIQPQGWLDLTFGLTEGWWKAADGDGRANYPLLPVDRWIRMLVDAGFAEGRELSASTSVAPYALIGATRAAHAGAVTGIRWVLAGRRAALREALHAGLEGHHVLDVPIEQLGEALAASSSGRESTHVVLCLDDVAPVARHGEGTAADAVALSTLFLDVLRMVVRHDRTRLSVVTRGARPVAGPGGSAPPPVSAASVIWGLGKTAALECPDHWGLLVDLEPGGHPRTEAALLLDTLTDSRAEDQQVWRGGVRLVPRLQARTTPAGAIGWPAPRGSVLVTGGTGAMGVQTVVGLAQAGYRHFCLLSRRAHVTDAAAAQLNAVRALGAVVHVVQGDAADADAVRRVLALIAQDGLSLQGIVHAAGVAQAESLALSTHDDLERVYRAKVQAPLVLTALTRDLDLDFLVGFSSMVALWGAKGQAVYAAGNHFLDDWAVAARRDGVPACTINWGPIAGGGMVPPAELARVASLGVRALPIGTVPGIVRQAIALDTPQVAALDVAWDVFCAHMDARGARPFLSRMQPPVAGPAHVPQGVGAGGHDVLDLVRREVAAVLGHADPDALDVDRGFFDIGLDSLTIVQLKTRLEGATGLTLPSTLGLEYPSISALAAHIRSLGTVTPARTTAASAPAARTGDEPIAIVGIGCRFPGGVTDPESYWRVLRDRVDAVRPFPTERWQHAPTGLAPTTLGGFLDGIDRFDADFFRLSAREAVSLDPQHRLLLRVAWETLEDAGAVYARSAGARVGVFAGVSASDYARRLTTPDAYYATGNALNAAPGRISYLFGFRGPSLAVDTACSSSLVAIRLACQSLRAGECDAALAGGVNLILSTETTQSLTRAKVLSPEGRCRAFDASADGMARAEGCGLLMLKSLSAARADGDRIYAVIRAAAMNQDGASGGFTVPSREAQEDLMRRALHEAGIAPAAVDYVEAHGTGTPLGDPIEARALSAVYGERRPSDRPLRIGSVKTNLGHTESASGVAGVIKTALALQRGEIPPQIHLTTPSPHIDWAQVPLRVVTERTAWPRGQRPRLAGVSSFGLSGTNAHIVLEEAPAERRVVPGTGAWPVVVSAASDDALVDRCRRLADWLEHVPDEAWHDVVYTLSARRTHFASRWAAVCASRTDAVVRLRAGATAAAARGDGPLVDDGDRVVAEYLRGAAVDWAAYWQGREGRVMSLPTYPFRTRSFWVEASPPASVTAEPDPMPETENVRSAVIHLVADLLQEAPSAIDVHRPFLEMGADSIILTEAVKLVEQRFGVTVAIRQMFESLTTIDALVRYIESHAGVVRTSVPQRRVQPSTTGAVAPGDWQQVFAQQFQQASQVLAQLAQQQLAFLAGQPGAPPLTTAPPTAAVSVPVATSGAALAGAGPSAFWKQEAPDRVALTPRQQAHIDALAARYVARTRGARNAEQADRTVFADMRTAIGFRLETKEMSYPIVAARSAGAHFWDVDGNRYVDMCMGFGVAFFGHQPPFVVEALTTQLTEGLQVGPQSRHAAEVARLICGMTGMERVTFCNSGTEAVMTALRVVRAATGRQRIVTFTGSYHGHSDPTLALAGTPGRGPAAVPMAPGVSPAAIGDTLVLPWGLDKALDVIEAEAPTLAAVLVEPVQSRRPGLHPKAFLQKVRDITRRHGVPLIFDEMITGFRVHPGGAQADFGIEADVVTYGKMIGGGLPLGVVAARGAFLDRIDGGAWHYGDTSYPAVERTFYAGTFCKHPLAMAAARAVLTELQRQGPQVQATLNVRTRDFVASINAIFQEEGAPLSLVHYGSLMRFNLAGNFSYLYQPLEMDVFCYHLIEKGVYIWEGRTLFLSTAHTDEDLDLIRQAVRDSVREMIDGGFFRDPASTHALTESQRDLWVLSRLGDDGVRAYQEGVSIEVDGVLDEAVLHQAARWLADRHEALRLRIAEDGLTQTVMPSVPVDCRMSTPDDLDAAQNAEARHVIDLARGPLWRIRAWRRQGGRTVLALYAHHIAVDGWSMGVILRELGEAYRALQVGTTPALPPAPGVLAFLSARGQRLASPNALAARDYWRTRLADAPPALDLPTDAPRPPLKTFAATRRVRELPPSLQQALTRLGAQEGCSAFMTVLAGFVALLQRVSGATDLVVGVPVAGRPAPGDAGLVGFCTHMIPVRVQVDPEQPVLDVLRRVRAAVLDAFDHQEWPLGRILEDVPVTPDLSRTPLFTTTFNLDRPLAVREFAGLPASLRALPVRAATYDLACNVVTDADRLVVSWDANTDLWEPETLDAWMLACERLLEAMSTSPQTPLGQVACAEAPDPDPGEAPPAFDTLHAWADASLRSRASSEALVCGDVRWTGDDLRRRVAAIEALLRREGVGRGDRVGVRLPRSADLVASLLAVLQTGAAYVPLDPGFPEARLSRMITHGDLAGVLLPDAGGGVRFERHAASAGDGQPATATDPAYVIYTSASTGEPKGVVISHGAVLNLLATLATRLGTGSQDTWLAITTVSFDISVLEIFLPLAHGLRLVVADDHDARDGGRLRRLLQQESVTCLQATPSGWRLLLESGWTGTPGLLVVCGGEALPQALAARLLPCGRALWNVYGPTETTIWSTAARVTDPARITIGRPLGNTQVYVVNTHGALQPIGVPGELWIGGAGLAIGYHHDNAATADRFRPNPFGGPSTRVYRTGDLVRWTPGGDLEFLGRMDHQVKVRGFRIELGEIESRAARCPGVQAAVAHVVDQPSGERAVALWYTVAAPDRPVDPQTVRAHVATHLPDYMVPTVIVPVAEFPRTPNGKVDRRALVRDAVAPATVVDHEPLQTPTEQRVATLWTEVLRVPVTSRHDDFLLLGGNSLLAARMAATLGNLSLREILEHRTVAQLAALLDAVGTPARVEIVL